MKKKKNRHHILPKCRGGGIQDSNLLSIEIEKHTCWHRLFGNLHIDEVISLLQRVKRMKKWNMYKEMYCWKCAGGKQKDIKTLQTVLEESVYPDGSVLFRAVCTICGTGNTFIQKGVKRENRPEGTS